MGPGYTFAIVWHERGRFLTGVLAVAFSALLITVQSGMLLGVFSIMSIPVDHVSRTFKDGEAVDVWVGHPAVLSVDLGQPIPEAWALRLARQPEFDRVEVSVIAFANWTRPFDQVALWQRRHGMESSSATDRKSVV